MITHDIETGCIPVSKLYPHEDVKTNKATIMTCYKGQHGPWEEVLCVIDAHNGAHRELQSSTHTHMSILSPKECRGSPRRYSNNIHVRMQVYMYACMSSKRHNMLHVYGVTIHVYGVTIHMVSRYMYMTSQYLIKNYPSNRARVMEGMNN